MTTDGAAEQRDTLDRLVGTVIADKYRVDRLIGQGGMGAVYQATNLAIGKRVALKFLTREAGRDRDAAERFQREAQAASLVESTHIVQIFDSGTSEEGLPFLVMELLSGEDLRARLRREGTLSIEETANIAAQVLRALIRAHTAGIVHRDLKPDNIFLCRRDDDSLFIKLVDFGISKLARSSTLDTLTQRGTVLGTAYYMSPEQAQAYPDIDGRTDLFSLGAIVFECLAGRPPHAGPTYESVLIAICTRDAEDIRELAPGVPPALARVIARALARDRSARFATATEMLDALLAAAPQAFVAPFGATPSGRLPSTPEPMSADSPAAFASTSRAPGTARKRQGTLVTAFIAVLAGFAVTAILVRSRTNSEASRARTPVVVTGSTLQQPIPAIIDEVVAPVAASSRTSAVASGEASPQRASRPVVTSPSAAPSPSPSASSLGIQSSQPTRSTLTPQAQRPQRPPRASGTSGTPSRGGVAKGLELSTKEP